MSSQYFSQHGEDRWIDEHLALPAVGVGVEVGCGRPVRFSNTYWLEKRGWDCVLIEADTRNIPALTTERRARVVHAAAVCAGTLGTVTLYQAADATLSSTRRGAPGKPIVVRAATLSTLLQEQGVGRIDLLSVDTEGTELDVLAGCDWARYRPAIVIVEYNTLGLPDVSEAVKDFMLRLPYRVAHKTPANLIFERTQA